MTKTARWTLVSWILGAGCAIAAAFLIRVWLGLCVTSLVFLGAGGLRSLGLILLDGLGNCPPRLWLTDTDAPVQDSAPKE